MGKETIETKKMSDLTGENASKLSESDRKLVNGVLTMGSKIPVIGAMINAGKTFKAVKNAIDKYKETKPRTGPDVTKRAEGGMIKGYKHGGSVKAGRLAKRGYGAAKK
tara:strand:- start:255 stop:578 length:324 start_codon:yes stop_codon:yes gene_type:complete